MCHISFLFLFSVFSLKQLIPGHKVVHESNFIFPFCAAFHAHSFLQPVKLEIIMEITGDLTGQKAGT